MAMGTGTSIEGTETGRGMGMDTGMGMGLGMCRGMFSHARRSREAGGLLLIIFDRNIFVRGNTWAKMGCLSDFTAPLDQGSANTHPRKGRVQPEQVFAETSNVPTPRNHCGQFRQRRRR